MAKFGVAFGVVLCLALAGAVEFDGFDDQVISLNDGPGFSVFLQVEDSPAYVEVPVHRVPIATTTIKTIKADKSACEQACNAEPQCKGFKHTEGTDECSLLAHNEAASNAPAAASPDAQVKAAAEAKAEAAKENAKDEKKKADVEKAKAEAAKEEAKDAKAKVEEEKKVVEEKKEEAKKEADKAEEVKKQAEEKKEEAEKKEKEAVEKQEG